VSNSVLEEDFAKYNAVITFSDGTPEELELTFKNFGGFFSKKVLSK